MRGPAGDEPGRNGMKWEKVHRPQKGCGIRSQLSELSVFGLGGIGENEYVLSYSEGGVSWKLMRWSAKAARSRRLMN